MTIAGTRYDTSGLKRSGTRWQSTERAPDGFTVVHPPGL
jgi:hypothetical protein